MKKTGQLIFNVFWVLLVGLASAISSGITGIALCLTIIGIPLGLQYFKYIKLIFAPAGKVVARKFSAHPVLNTFWLIFGGLEWYIIYQLLALVFYITIIGIPISKQLSKIADFHLAPFGCEIVAEEEYTSRKDTAHDRQLLIRRMVADENITEKLSDARNDAIEVYNSKLNIDRFKSSNRGKSMAIIVVVVTFVGYFVLNNIIRKIEGANAQVIGVVLGIIFVLALLIQIILHILHTLEWNKFYQKHLFPLIDQYPNGSPILEKKCSVEVAMIMIGLLDNDEENLSAKFIKHRQIKK